MLIFVHVCIFILSFSNIKRLFGSLSGTPVIAWRSVFASGLIIKLCFLNQLYLKRLYLGFYYLPDGLEKWFLLFFSVLFI